MKSNKSICLLLSFAILISFSVNANASNEENKVFSQNREKSNMIALTFDDGPHPRYTEKILSILEEYGITATFFVIGINAVNYPSAMQSLTDSGCEIGNHTFSHKLLDREKSESITEIKKCEELIKNHIDVDSKLLRPPQGKLNADTITVANKLDYNIILWSIDTLDWNHNSPQNIANMVVSSVKGGDIILMHDYISGGSPTCEALRIFIPILLAKGYEFVTVSELIS